MKNYLLLTAGLLLAGCSKGGGDPAPASVSPTGASWSLNSSTTVTTPNSGGSPSTQSKSFGTGAINVQFTSDGKVVQTRDKSTTATGSNQVVSGTYTYSAGVVSTSYPGAGANGTAYSETSSSLTNNSLVLVHTDQTSSNKYVTTDSYSR